MKSRRRRYNPETGEMEYYTLQTKNELNAKKRERYKDNKDAEHERRVRYYRDNVQSIKEKNANYYENNKSKVLKKASDYRLANRDEINRKKREAYERSKS